MVNPNLITADVLRPFGIDVTPIGLQRQVSPIDSEPVTAEEAEALVLETYETYLKHPPTTAGGLHIWSLVKTAVKPIP